MRIVLSAIFLLMCFASEGMAQNISFKTEDLKKVATELNLLTSSLKKHVFYN